MGWWKKKLRRSKNIIRHGRDKKIILFVLFSLLFGTQAFSGESILLKKYNSSLVSHWTFNENRSIIVGDSGSGNNHGLVQGDAKNYSWSSDSVEGSALSLSGNAYVQVENAPSLSMTGDFTISFWFLCRNVTSKSKLISKRSLSNEFALYLIGIENGKIFGGVGNGKEVSLIPKEQTISPGVWHFVVMVYDSKARQLKLFLDGQKVSEESAISSISTGNAKLAIGADYEGMTDFFDGIIDSVSLFSTAISDADVAEEAGQYDILSIRMLSDRQIESQRKNFLVGHWDFDIGHGNIIRDRSGTNNHGVLKNMSVDAWREAFIGSCVEFDGKDDVMIIKHSSSLDFRRGFTLSAWVYPTGFGERSKLISKRKGSANYNFYLIGEDRGKLYAGVGDGELVTLTPKMTSLKLNEWQHVAATFNLYKGRLTLYFNGKKVEEVNCNHMVDSKDSGLTIGAGLEGQEGFFKGMVDEVSVYSIGLPDISVQTIYDKDYFKFKALEEQRELIRKIKIEIEETRKKIIRINEELGVLEDIGSPEKGQEEAFLNLLKERLKRKTDELEYQKKVKIQKIRVINENITRLIEDINVIHDILSLEKVLLEKIDENFSQSLKQMDQQIQKGEELVSNLSRLQEQAQQKIRGKTEELKERIRELDREIDQEKSQIKSFSAELEIPASFPTLFYQKLPKTEPEFRHLFQEQQEKTRYLATLQKMTEKLKKELSEKKDRFKKLVEDNRSRLRSVLGELGGVADEIDEKVPAYSYGQDYKDWLPEILRIYNAEKTYLEQAESLIRAWKKKRDDLLKEYTQNLKQINQSIREKRDGLRSVLGELGEPQKIPVTVSEYIPEKIKDIRRQYEENRSVLKTLEDRYEAAKIRLETKKKEERQQTINTLKQQIQKEIVEINTINTELGVSEQILPEFEEGKLPELSLVGYYKFDNPKQYTENDFTGKSSPAELVNFEFGGWEQGQYQMALQFNGVNTFGKINKVNFRDPDKFSVLFWFYPDRFWGERTIIYSGVLGKTNVCFIEEDEDKLVFGVGDLKSIRRFNLNIRLKKDTWYHIAVIIDNQEKIMNFFLDGKSILSQALPFPVQFGNPVWLGSATGKQKFFSGRIDELKFYQGVVRSQFLSEKMQEEKVEVAIDDIDRLKGILDDLVRKRKLKEKEVAEKREAEEKRRQQLLAQIKEKEKELNSVLRELGEEVQVIDVPRGQEEKTYNDVVMKISMKQQELERRREEEERRRRELLLKIDKEKQMLSSILKELGEGPAPEFAVVSGKEEETLEKVVTLRRQKEKALEEKKERERIEAERRKKEQEQKLKEEIEKHRKEIQRLEEEIRGINKKLDLKEQKFRGVDLGMESLQDLIGYFKFNTPEETEVKNDANKNVRLFIYNIRDNTWTGGRYDGGMELNGVDSYAIIKNLDLFISNEFTVLLWIQPTRFWGTRKILSSGSRDSDKGILTIEERENILYAGSGKGRFLRSIISEEVRLRRGTWEHLILRVKDKDADFFYNGKKISSVSLRDPIVFETETFLGSEQGKTEFLSAFVDELKIYNRALSDEEILKGGREIEYTATDSVVDQLKKYVEELRAELEKKKKQWAMKQEEIRLRRARILEEAAKERDRLNYILNELGEPPVEERDIAEGAEESYLESLRQASIRKKAELDRKIEERKKEVERLKAAFDQESEKLKDLLAKLGERPVVGIAFNRDAPEKSLDEIERKRKEKERDYLKKVETERQRRAYYQKEITDRTRRLNELLGELGESPEKPDLTEGKEEQTLRMLEERVALKQKEVEDRRKKEAELRTRLRKEITDTRIELAQVLIDLGESPPAQEEVKIGEEQKTLDTLKFQLSSAKERLEQKRKAEAERRQKLVRQIEEEKKKLSDILVKIGEDAGAYPFPVVERQEEDILKKITQVRLEKEKEYQFRLAEEKRKKEQERRERLKTLEASIKEEREKLKDINEKLGITEEFEAIGRVEGPEVENLLAYFKFDEGQGEQIQDWRNEEKSISLKGMDVDMWVEGRFGHAVFFNGVSGYGIIEAPQNIKSLPPVTISTWIYPTRFWGNRTILMINDENSPDGHLSISIEENELFVAMKKRGIDFRLKRKAVLFKNNWYHVVVTYNQALSRLSLFVNNNLISQISIDADIRKINTITVASKNGRQEFFAGRIDDLRIYGKVFNREEIIQLGQEIKVQEVFEDLSKMEQYYSKLLEKRQSREKELRAKVEEEQKRIASIKQKIEKEKEELMTIMKQLGEPPIVSVVIKEGQEGEALENLRKQKKEKQEELDKRIKEKKEKREQLLISIEAKLDQLNQVLKELGEPVQSLPEVREGQEEKVLSSLEKLVEDKTESLLKKREEEREHRRALLIKIEEAKIQLGLLQEKLGIPGKVEIDVPSGKEEEILSSLNQTIEQREKELKAKLEEERLARRKEFLDKIEEKKRALYDLMDKLGEKERPEFKVREGEEIKVLKEIDTLISGKKERYRSIQEEKQREIMQLRADFMSLTEKLNNVLTELGEPESSISFDEENAQSSVQQAKGVLNAKSEELAAKKEEERRRQEQILKDKEMLVKNMEEEKQNILKLVDALGIESYSFPVDFGVSDEIRKEKLIIFYDFNAPTYNTVPNKAIARYSARMNEIRRENWADGKYGKSLDFNGVNNFINVQGIACPVKENITFMLWIYPTRFWGSRTIVMLKDTDAQLKLAEEDDNVYIQFQSSYQKKAYNNIVQLKKNTWQHLAFSFDNRTQKFVFLYNGKPVFERYLELKFEGNISGLMVGAYEGKSEFFSGRIDEFRLYNSYLGPAEVTQKMEETKIITPEDTLENVKVKVVKLREEKTRLEKEYQVMMERKRKERERILQAIEKERAEINNLKEKMGEPADYRIDIPEGKENDILAMVREDRQKVDREWKDYLKDKEEHRQKFMRLIDEEKAKIIDLKKKLKEVPVYQVDIVEGYEEDIYNKVKQYRIKKEEEWTLMVREEKRKQHIAALEEIEKARTELNAILSELGEPLYQVPEIPEGKEVDVQKKISAELVSARMRLEKKKEEEKIARMQQLEKERRENLIRSIVEVTKSIRDFEKELGIKTVEALIEEEVIKDRTLKAYIKFDKTGGFSADDTSGYANTGFIKGTDIYQWEKGKYGNAFTFSGVVGWFEIPSSPTLASLEEFTVMLWVYPKRFFDNRTIFYYASPDGTRYLKLRIKENRVFIDLQNYREKVNVDTGIDLDKEKWQHLAFSYSRKTTRILIFLNGQKVTDIESKIRLDLDSQPLFLGSTGKDEFFAGRIDEFKLFSRILDEQEVVKNMEEMVVDEQTLYQTLALNELETKFIEISKRKDDLEQQVAEKRKKELEQKKAEEERERLLQERRERLAEKRKQEQEKELEREREKEIEKEAVVEKPVEPLDEAERLRQKLAMLKKKIEKEMIPGMKPEEKVEEKGKEIPLVFDLSFDSLTRDGSVQSRVGNAKASLVNLSKKNIVESIEGSGLHITDGGYAVLDSSYTRSLDKEFTLSFWLKSYSLTDSVVLEKGAFRMDLTGGKLEGYFSTQPSQKLSYAIKQNKWYAVAVTFNSFSGDLKLFVNGVREQTLNVNADLSLFAGDLTIGKGAQDEGSRFNGIFDEFRLSSKELTGEQLAIKIPFNIEINLDAPAKTTSRTVVLKLSADNAYQFMVYETGYKKEARWENMRDRKILIVSGNEGKKEIQCLFRSWFGIESSINALTVEYMKEEPRVQLYAPPEGAVVTGKR